MIDKEHDIFYDKKDWDDDDDLCLFFNMNVNEVPVITSPLAGDWDESYFTHFMKLPVAFTLNSNFEETVELSELEQI